MKEEITRNIVQSICDDFRKTIIDNLKEDEKGFPLLLATINLVLELREKGIYVELNNVFIDIYLDKVYRELETFITK